MRYFLFDANRLDSGTGGTATHRLFDAVHRLTFAFEVDLDATVGQVPDPPVQPFALSGLEGKVSKPDGLDAPGDQISPRDAHGR